jgi:AraC-like DNA-binding protein
MDEHYTERISLDDSSSKVGMSKSHFKRFFRRVTGQTFITHLSRFRIAKAQALLVSTDRSIAEISQEVGFCSQSYFGVVFQKFAHMSPYQYRKRRQRMQENGRPGRARAMSSEVPIESGPRAARPGKDTESGNPDDRADR